MNSKVKMLLYVGGGLLLILFLIGLFGPKVEEEVEQSQTSENVDEEIVKTVKKYFSSSILKDVVYTNTMLNIQIKQQPDMESYFENGDKINKIKSTEVVRIMSKHPEIQIINLYFYDKNDNLSSGAISRKDLESYLGVKITEMDWRKDFLEKYDNKEERAKFVNQFYK